MPTPMGTHNKTIAGSGSRNNSTKQGTTMPDATAPLNFTGRAASEPTKARTPTHTTESPANPKLNLGDGFCKRTHGQCSGRYPLLTRHFSTLPLISCVARSLHPGSDFDASRSRDGSTARSKAVNAAMAIAPIRFRVRALIWQVQSRISSQIGLPSLTNHPMPLGQVKRLASRVCRSASKCPSRPAPGIAAIKTRGQVIGEAGPAPGREPLSGRIAEATVQVLTAAWSAVHGISERGRSTRPAARKGRSLRGQASVRADPTYTGSTDWLDIAASMAKALRM
jgi:hypothetical protein